MEFLIFLLIMIPCHYFAYLLMIMFNSDLFYDLYVHQSYIFSKFKKIYKKEVKNDNK